MITGFNTDIEFGGVTYHVQTEDKGLSRPVIMSLVYDRGTILASKRIPYDDLVQSGFDEKVLGDRLQRQHKLMCAAVRAGRLEDLKKMTLRDSAAMRSAPATEPAFEPAFAGTAFDRRKPLAVLADAPIPRPGNNGIHESSAAFDFEGPIVDPIAVIEDPFLLPAEAVAVIQDKPGADRAANNKLSLEVLGDTSFKGGDRKSVGFMVCRGAARKVVGNAQIMVKILGSSFRPQIFHARTDANGIARINLQLPSFSDGRAAFLVRAISDGEEIELRRPIAHG